MRPDESIMYTNDCEFLVFLDKQNVVIGYQLSPNYIKKYKYKVPGYSHDAIPGTNIVVIVNGIRAKISYKFSLGVSVINYYRIEKMDQAHFLNEVDDELKDMNDCAGFVATSPVLGGKLKACCICTNEKYCYDGINGKGV